MHKFLILTLVLLTSCKVLTPLPPASQFQQRLAAFPREELPLGSPVTLYWDKHQIPFIEGSRDEDVAFMLGMVHAHLRLGQMEFLRRVSQGRLAEMGGIYATDIDHALRILNFAKAAEESEDLLPVETQLWLGRFVEGINFYLMRVEDLPHEFKVLNMERERWTIRDLLTLMRLYGTDVNWLVWLSAISMSEEPGVDRFWRDHATADAESQLSFRAGKGDLAELEGMLSGFSRSGSNSLVVSGDKSVSGSAMIASDPHLGITLPNIWLLAGYRSKSFHVTGLMLPGAPFVALGRNPHIAWGGTNMRGLSSSFYDLSRIPEEEFSEREEIIGVRAWWDTTRKVRESPWGPVVSDAPYFREKDVRPFSLRWVGHEPSDEMSVFLRMNRASNFEEFRNAFQGYAVSAQNFLYADREGNIGHVLAMKRPFHQSGNEPKLFLDPRKAEDQWVGFLETKDLPTAFNPAEGFIASANNKPVELPYALGHVYSEENRVSRLKELAEGVDKIDLNFLKKLQNDAYSRSSHEIAKAFISQVEAFQIPLSRSVQAIQTWDGVYDADSKGALAFELAMSSFAPEVLEQLYPESESLRDTLLRGTRWKKIVKQALSESSLEDLSRHLKNALSVADTGFAEYSGWGDKHEVELGHPLKNIPFLGSRYVFLRFPARGSSDTLLKSAHALSADDTSTFYGSNARHVSDLSDINENYFVLLGGQDGWFGSENALDHSLLWRRGEYIKMPLETDALKVQAKTIWKLEPSPGAQLNK